MSAIPISAAMLVADQYGFTTPFAESPGWVKRYGNVEVSQFNSAEMIAEKWDISREDMERFALNSHNRAKAAIAEGRFESEIAPVTLADGTIFTTDECPRDTSLEKMAALEPLAPGGRITAGVASQICDGASAMLIASERAVKEHNLTPRARIHHLSVKGDDPIWMLTGPIRATRNALEKTGLTVDDIDLFECNEAFASVVLAWAKELEIPLEKVNVNGGGIALGHPIGATGTRIMTTMLNELERTGGRYALQTMCEGGGQANVTIIERL
jgi:acetyl-CoA C-acetyltransferase